MLLKFSRVALLVGVLVCAAAAHDEQAEVAKLIADHFPQHVGKEAALASQAGGVPALLKQLTRSYHIKTASAFYELYNPSVVQSGRIEIILNQKAEDEGAFIAGLPARAADITKARSAVKQMLTDYQPLKSSDDEVNRLMWKYFDREDELVAKLEKKYAGNTKSGAGDLYLCYFPVVFVQFPDAGLQTCGGAALNIFAVDGERSGLAFGLLHHRAEGAPPWLVVPHPPPPLVVHQLSGGRNEVVELVAVGADEGHTSRGSCCLRRRTRTLLRYAVRSLATPAPSPCTRNQSDPYTPAWKRMESPTSTPSA
jgi:hypothetical protein